MADSMESRVRARWMNSLGSDLAVGTPFIRASQKDDKSKMFVRVLLVILGTIVVIAMSGLGTWFVFCRKNNMDMVTAARGEPKTPMLQETATTPEAREMDRRAREERVMVPWVGIDGEMPTFLSQEQEEEVDDQQCHAVPEDPPMITRDIIEMGLTYDDGYDDDGDGDDGDSNRDDDEGRRNQDWDDGTWE